MKYRDAIYPLLLLFLLYNCSNHKEKEESVVLKHKAIDLNDHFIGHGGFLTTYKNKVIGMETSSALPPFFCLTSDEDTSAFYQFGNRGQGPNEFMLPYCIQHIEGEIIGILDMSTKIYYEFHLPEENHEIKINKKISFDFPPSRIIKTAYNQYIGLSMQDKLFTLFDSEGKQVQPFFKYPYRNKEEEQLDNKIRALAYQGTLAVNASKTKFAYATFRGEIIHFYNIGHNDITPIAKIENEYPLYRNNSNNDFTNVMIGKEGLQGYISSYGTEQYVYALFNGKKVQERDEKNYTFEASILRIFDWKGHLVKEYQLDIPCCYLCVSDDDHRIWAIATKPEMSLVCFDLIPQENKPDDKEIKQTGISEKKQELPPNNHIINTRPITIGKIQTNKTIHMNVALKSRVISATTKEQNIAIQDTTLSSNKPALSVSITKTEPGFFSDTIHVVTDSAQVYIVFSGEVLLSE